MRSLYLVRHAKAESNFQGIRDIDRPLHQKGIIEANAIAEELKNLNVKPDVLICSPAYRATGTALIFQRILQTTQHDFQFAHRLYEIETDDLKDFIAQLDNKYSTVMLFGHNPAFTYFSLQLDSSVSHMPTGSVVRFDFDCDSWEQVLEAKVELKLFVYP